MTKINLLCLALLFIQFKKKKSFVEYQPYAREKESAIELVLKLIALRGKYAH